MTWVLEHRLSGALLGEEGAAYEYDTKLKAYQAKVTFMAQNPELLELWHVEPKHILSPRHVPPPHGGGTPIAPRAGAVLAS